MSVRSVPVPSIIPEFNPSTQSIGQVQLSIPPSLITDEKIKTKKKNKKDNTPKSDDTSPDHSSKDYVIIGFDTEYQGRGLDPEGLRHNEILSYQHHCKLSNGAEWNGIYCPPPNERITLGQFLLLALSEGYRHGVLPDHVPRDITLVGHFNRADLPAFSDFHEFQKFLSSVRGTFITMGTRRLDVPLVFADGLEKSFKVRVRDTLLLAPEKARSLEAIGDLVGVPKVKLHDDPAQARSIIANMKSLREEDWELFKAYALTDARICTLYAEKFGHLMKRELGQFQIPSTLSSVGVKLIQQEWELSGLERLRLLGKVIEQKQVWDSRRQQYFTRKQEVYLPPLHDEEQFATECFHGGRNEQYWFGPSYSASWSDWDFASAYPTAMSLIMPPDWDNPRYTCDVDEFTSLAFGFARVSFQFPCSIRCPTIPVRTVHGLVFPLSGEAYICAPEIALARRLGAQIEIKKGLIFPTSDTEYVFRNFDKECLRRRAIARTGFENALWKEVLNSTYGKTAQGLKPKRVYDNRSEDTRQIPESEITNPFYAAFITSFVRSVVGEIMNNLPAHTMVFSCTTDGFITDASDDEVTHACRGPLTQLALQARRDLTGKKAANVLEKKHAARMLLGWTTRGQATLIPWVGQELVVSSTAATHMGHLPIRSAVLPTDPEFGHILAKGGIKVPNHLDTKDDKNRFIVQLFKNRTPKSTIDVDHFISLKEMLEEETDLITQTHTRRLGMEYDFKRRPVAWGPHVNGHLVFSTQPWDSIDEYQRFRAAVDAYQKADRKCLKTVHDLENMLAYVHLKMTPRAGTRGYTTKKDADLNILKRVISSAFAHGLGGLAYKSARVLAEHMSESGIPTKAKDIENARRNAKDRPFEPQPCPTTARSRDVVASLKGLYPVFDEALVFGQVVPETTDEPHASVWDRLFVERAGIQNPFEAYLTNFAVWDAEADCWGGDLDQSMARSRTLAQ